MFYMDIWKILGIEPTSDIKEIKKAYTALAKKTNPEDDPDGFRKLHDAYRAALSYAKRPAPVNTVPVPVSAERPAEAAPFEEEKEKEDPYDYSSVSYKAASGDPVSDMREIIRVFREINNIDSLASVGLLKHMDHVRLIRDLIARYMKMAIFRRDTEVWDEFFEEPLVRYFECDPEFRALILEYTKPKVPGSTFYEEQYAAVRKILDSFEGLPPEHRWNPDKEIKGADSKKISWIIVAFAIGVIALMALYARIASFLV